MEKQVKCKHCKLTYSKKSYECPYCHTKRFNPTGLIIFIILLLIAAGIIYYFKHDEINTMIINKANTVETESGIKFDNFILEKTEEENIYRVQFDITNNTGSTYEMKYILYNLADKIYCAIHEYNPLKYDINVNIINDSKYRAEYNVELPEEWEVFELYIKEYDENNPEDNKEEIKLFTYYNNFDNVLETT